MRLLVTADLHYNHAKSKALAEEVIEQMNRAGGDVLVVGGDTSVPEGDSLEQCLSRFRFGGEKLFVAGNHELWTQGGDSYALFKEELPRRVRELGWRWLQSGPVVMGGVGIVGSIGWYDYSFGPDYLGIPLRFYENKISPGAAARLEEFAGLFESREDIGAGALEVVARWNDGRFVKLGRSDAEFLGELMGELEGQLEGLREVRTVVAAVHHVPFAEFLPPPRSGMWDFAKAFLGSARMGEVLKRYGNVKHVFCGHSHLPGEVQIGGIRAVNIGSGYRWKTYRSLDVE